jgi:NAD(P)-dependent dehydrogenase (short-subunit alcohol dehydrogenase family)
MGADVVVHFHQAETRDQAEETARLVAAQGVRAALTMGDLGQVENVRAMYDTAERAFGGVDVVVNNAGAILKKPLAEFTDAEFERLDAINNRALFYSLREAALRMRDGGRIINTGTSLKAGAAPGYTIYSGTKAPVEEYSRMLAKELGPRRITVNTIAPGPVDTPFFHAQETEASAAFAARLSTEQRLGEVADIAPLAGFLASPESQWINGQTVWINGGYLTR